MFIFVKNMFSLFTDLNGSIVPFTPTTHAPPPPPPPPPSPPSAADDQEHVQEMLAEFEVKRGREQQEELEVLRTQWDQQRDVTQRDTFDLNDPRALAKDMPARIGDEDPRNGPSSMQKFDGEDLHFADRLRMQQGQMREWHASQTSEVLRRKDDEVASDMQWAQLNVTVDNLRMENEIKALQERTQFNHEYQEANRAQAMEKCAREARARQLQASAEERELAMAADSAWINEKREHEVSMLGAHRVRPDHMKGFTQEQLDDIRRTQRSQMQEKEVEKLQERENEAQWAENQRLMYSAMQEAEMAQLLERQQANQQSFEDTLSQRREVFERKQREDDRIRAAGFEEVRRSRGCARGGARLRVGRYAGGEGSRRGDTMWVGVPVGVPVPADGWWV